MKDLKTVYQANTEEQAFNQLTFSKINGTNNIQLQYAVGKVMKTKIVFPNDDSLRKML